MTHHKGFTLIETLVAIALFIIILVPAVNLFVSSISTQKQAVWGRKLADELSFFTESLSRALREAKKSTGSCGIASGWNYQTDVSKTEILYIDSNDRCHRVYRQVDANGIGVLSDDLGGGVIVTLTSPNVDVQALRFELRGAQGLPDAEQPRVTLFIEGVASRVPAASAPRMKLQTTISQRNLDE